ncbi:MAG TPA: hypothetical protein VLZ83_09350 [Edaphocola sp.]|nr:hypothetical protein [Edaphocola sp.]
MKKRILGLITALTLFFTVGIGLQVNAQRGAQKFNKERYEQNHRPYHKNNFKYGKSYQKHYKKKRMHQKESQYKATIRK